MRTDAEMDRLIEEGLQFGEYQTKEDLVHAALKEYIRYCKRLKGPYRPSKHALRAPLRQPRERR